MKTVVVGSHNPVKVEAVREAFAHVFPDDEFIFIPCSAASGVPDQPFGSEETKRGARNRAEDCRLKNEGDFFVGLEGGIEEEGEEYWAAAWMCMIDREGTYGYGKTSSFLLPPRMAELIKEGKEQGHAADIAFETNNSKQEGGTVGILTKGIITRKDFYRDALILALIPFIQTSLYK